MDLPNILFLARKLEPLGTDFKDSGCKIIRGLKFLELQRVKMGMRAKEFCNQLGATAACTIRIVKGGEQETLPGQKESVLQDSWFGSVTCTDALGTHCPNNRSPYNGFRQRALFIRVSNITFEHIFI